MVVLSTWQTRVKRVKNFLAEVTRPEGKCDWMACNFNRMHHSGLHSIGYVTMRLIEVGFADVRMKAMVGRPDLINPEVY